MHTHTRHRDRLQLATKRNHHAQCQIEQTAVFEVGHPIDSGIGLSITIDKIRVFINKTLSTESLINQLLIRGLSYQLLLIMVRLGKV